MLHLKKTAGAIVAVALACCVWVMPALAGVRTIASEDEATPLSALGDRVVWSHRVADGEYELWTWTVGGSARRLPVAARQLPFDVNLGTDARGRMVAIYSRCRAQDADSRRGCDLFQFSFAAGREQAVRGTNSLSASEFAPAIDRGTIAFARRPDRQSAITSLRYRPAGAKVLKALARPRPDPRNMAALGDGGPTGMTLRKGVLALDWVFAATRCTGIRIIDDDDIFGPTQSFVYALRLDGQPRTLDSGCTYAHVDRVGSVSSTASGPVYVRSSGTTTRTTRTTLVGAQSFRQQLPRNTAFASRSGSGTYASLGSRPARIVRITGG